MIVKSLVIPASHLSAVVDVETFVLRSSNWFRNLSKPNEFQRSISWFYYYDVCSTYPVYLFIGFSRFSIGIVFENFHCKEIETYRKYNYKSSNLGIRKV